MPRTKSTYDISHLKKDLEDVKDQLKVLNHKIVAMNKYYAKQLSIKEQEKYKLNKKLKNTQKPTKREYKK